MKDKHSILSFPSLLILLVFTITSNAFASSITYDSLRIDTTRLAMPILLPTSEILIDYNPYVLNYAAIYKQNNYAETKIMLSRGNKYWKTIEKIFKEEQVPDELKYLAYLESKFYLNTSSPYGAKGMWQFMRGTAQNFGLTVNNKVDERVQVEKSTRAAAKYLKYLFRYFKDWYLVIAAYNCGDAVVSNAMKKAGSNNFWDIYQYLPRETRVYVPHFVGILDAMNEYMVDIRLNELAVYQNYHLESNPIPVPYNTKSLVVRNYEKSMVVTPKEAKIDSTLDYINKKVEINLTANNENSDIYKKDFFIYVVQKGDDLKSISAAFPKNSIELIKRNNNIRVNLQLVSGSTLLLEK